MPKTTTTAKPPTTTTLAPTVTRTATTTTRTQTKTRTNTLTSTTTTTKTFTTTTKTWTGTSTTTTTTTLLHLVPVEVSETAVKPGLAVQRFVQKTGNAEVIAIDSRIDHATSYLSEVTLRWQGFLRIYRAGNYQFRTLSSGFCQFTLSGEILLRTSSGLGKVVNQTRLITLASGLHALSLLFSEHDSSAGIAFEYAGPDTGGDFVVADNFFHPTGPCALTGIGQADSVPCEGPRWALSSGESCHLACRFGYFANGLIGKGHHQVLCLNGVLHPTEDARCELLRCPAPVVGNASNTSSCAEGPEIESGGSCTPVCEPGYRPKANSSGGLHCYNGTLKGGFECIPERPCTPPVGLAHAASQPCQNAPSLVEHGEKCLASCEAGYRPDVQPQCQDGTFVPLTFACEPIPPPKVYPCTAPPKVSNASSPSCLQGSVIESGASCSPACEHGFGVEMLVGTMHCNNGTFNGSFGCYPKQPCTALPRPPHASSSPCSNLPSVIADGSGNDASASGLTTTMMMVHMLHGSICETTCQEGYEASGNLVCEDGHLVPPSFTCSEPPMSFEEHVGKVLQWLPIIGLVLAASALLYLLGSALCSWYSSLAGRRYRRYNDFDGGSEERLTRDYSRGSYSGGESPEDSSPQSPSPASASEGYRTGRRTSPRRGKSMVSDVQMDLEENRMRTFGRLDVPGSFASSGSRSYARQDEGPWSQRSGRRGRGGGWSEGDWEEEQDGEQDRRAESQPRSQAWRANANMKLSTSTSFASSSRYGREGPGEPEGSARQLDVLSASRRSHERLLESSWRPLHSQGSLGQLSTPLSGSFGSHHTGQHWR